LFRSERSVRLALESLNDGAVDNAVQQRHRQRRITQVVRPVVEVDVRDQRRRSAPVAMIDDLVEQA